MWPKVLLLLTRPIPLTNTVCAPHTHIIDLLDGQQPKVAVRRTGGCSVRLDRVSDEIDPPSSAAAARNHPSTLTLGPALSLTVAGVSDLGLLTLKMLNL